MTDDHKKELPRVRGLFSKLSASVEEYEAEREAYSTELKNIVEEIQDVERSLEETKPTLARSVDWSVLSMSLFELILIGGIDYLNLYLIIYIK